MARQELTVKTLSADDPEADAVAMCPNCHNQMLAYLWKSGQIAPVVADAFVTSTGPTSLTIECPACGQVERYLPLNNAGA